MSEWALFCRSRTFRRRVFPRAMLYMSHYLRLKSTVYSFLSKSQYWVFPIYERFFYISHSFKCMPTIETHFQEFRNLSMVGNPWSTSFCSKRPHAFLQTSGYHYEPSLTLFKNPILVVPTFKFLGLVLDIKYFLVYHANTDWTVR